ncbi:putative HD superfamily hydrolase involved in NAD metabolism [Orenia metallireducens]|uniref:bis(5'-nucleosyl)-tetraphosphatase (symmetrical) n=1 Tax=Orenia metallireducens TaxID=1413210 RepID=A0A285IB11_9FIRM|nr:bis(5'-nucleosyl)-tetraphosphatase (symmetrical) YqeK [Orenia metallireducens]PRX20613.1 putative HD superfamily hydrolase involved in NAD metabolism [Orenia metallireducens]SNY45162.1 putative HD superfamily hydrolase of NAD metabolism [Orenia metallireducens]
MTENQAIEKLSTMIGEKRLKHTLGVRDTAIDLAKKYDVDVEKARWAGLLHDCAKRISNNLLLQRAEEFGIVIDDIYKRVPTLLHAPIGAEIAKREFGIDDVDILNAISLHTLGHKDMTTLDKIIFLADYIEPNRDCEAINQLRESIKDKSLDEAVRLACENTLKYNLEEGRVIHPQSVELRNSLISN